MYDGRSSHEGTGPQERRPLVSIRDIAKCIGLSHCAVSMALRGSPRISPATRQRVKAVAESMGYRPDPIFTALAKSRITRDARFLPARLAWIAPARNSRPSGSSPSRQAACDEATRHGYELVGVTPDEESGPDDLHERLSCDGIRGILLAWDHLPEAWLRFPWQHYSVVKVGEPGNAHFHGVAPNVVENALLAFEEVRQRGYQRVGMITLLPDKGFLNPRATAGFLTAQASIPETDRVPPHAASSRGTGKLREWLARHRPDAIIADSAVVIRLLDKVGIRTPNDIGVALTSVPTGADVAGIHTHPEIIGKDAVKLLRSLIHDRRCGFPEMIQRHLINGCWQDGATLPIRGKSRPVLPT